MKHSNILDLINYIPKMPLSKLVVRNESGFKFRLESEFFWQKYLIDSAAYTYYGFSGDSGVKNPHLPMQKM